MLTIPQGAARLSNCYILVNTEYSQTCIKRPLKGSLRSGLLIQVVS